METMNEEAPKKSLNFIEKITHARRINLSINIICHVVNEFIFSIIYFVGLNALFILSIMLAFFIF